MAMAGAVPAIAVLALGAGALGGPHALQLLMIELAGRNPAFDIGIIVFLISMFAVQLLGTLLLARYVRKPPPAGVAASARRRAPRAPVADYFARITLLMSLAAAALVTACHVLVSGGPVSVVRLLVGFVAEYCYPTVIAAAAATGVALYAAHLLGAFREQRNARGGAAPAERATTTPTHAARFIGARLAAAGGAALPWIAPLLRAFRVHRNARGRAAHAERATTTNHGERAPLAAAAAVCALVVAITFGAYGGLDAHRLSPRPSFANMPVAIAVVVGAALLVSFHCRARNAAAAGGAAPAAPTTASAR
ncbi:unnamed protein product [Urochloa humidicola]